MRTVKLEFHADDGGEISLLEAADATVQAFAAYAALIVKHETDRSCARGAAQVGLHLNAWTERARGFLLAAMRDANVIGVDDYLIEQAPLAEISETRRDQSGRVEAVIKRTGRVL